MTRRASGLPRSRSASRCACWSSTSPRRTSRRRRRSSSIRRSSKARDDRSVYEEGCLSIPDYYAEVERPATVRVKYLDRDGKAQEVEAEGLLATCLQHEIDHLERRAVHRPHLEAEARHGGEEVQEARQGPPAEPDGRVRRFLRVRLDLGGIPVERDLTSLDSATSNAASHHLHGHAGIFRADAARARRGRASRSSPSTRSRRGRPAGAGWN